MRERIGEMPWEMAPVGGLHETPSDRAAKSTRARWPLRSAGEPPVGASSAAIRFHRRRGAEPVALAPVVVSGDAARRSELWRSAVVGPLDGPIDWKRLEAKLNAAQRDRRHPIPASDRIGGRGRLRAQPPALTRVQLLENGPVAGQMSDW